MKSLLLTTLLITVVASCAPRQPMPGLGDDTEIGERLYTGINSMQKVDSFPEYSEVEAARSAYYEWKIKFIEKHGEISWREFVLRMRNTHGEPKAGYDGLLLDPKSM